MLDSTAMRPRVSRCPIRASLLIPALSVAVLVADRDWAGEPAPPLPSFVKAIPHCHLPGDPGWRQDDRLQARLDQAVQDLGLQELAAARKLGIALVDLSEPTPRLASLNGSTMLYAASVPKLAVLYAAFQARHEGRLRFDASLVRTLNDMVRVSSNTAASRAIQRLGFGYIASLLWQARLYDPRHGGGLWLGKAFGGENDRWYRDPVAGTSHGATPLAVARLLTLIAEDRLIDAKSSREMREILGNPGLHHKFVAGLDARPGSQIFRKSGTWHDWHADAALVERGATRYVAVALCEDPGGSKILERLIVALDNCVVRTASQERLASLDPPAARTVRLR